MGSDSSNPLNIKDPHRLNEKEAISKLKGCGEYDKIRDEIMEKFKSNFDAIEARLTRFLSDRSQPFIQACRSRRPIHILIERAVREVLNDESTRRMADQVADIVACEVRKREGDLAKRVIAENGERKEKNEREECEEFGAKKKKKKKEEEEEEEGVDGEKKGGNDVSNSKNNDGDKNKMETVLSNGKDEVLGEKKEQKQEAVKGSKFILSSSDAASRPCKDTQDSGKGAKSDAEKSSASNVSVSIREEESKPKANDNANDMKKKRPYTEVSQSDSDSTSNNYNDDGGGGGGKNSDNNNNKNKNENENDVDDGLRRSKRARK